MRMDHQRIVRVVVGLDGTKYDGGVLVAAIMEAGRRTAILRVVHAVEITMLDITADPPTAIRRRTEQAAHMSAVRSDLQLQVAATAAALGVSVPVEYLVERGDPATCVLSAARHAELIVAGARSTGRGSPLLLGMVSQDIAVHASCPVLLIPPTA
jgi:nucleotide-binding universal stress UspA family protein